MLIYNQKLRNGGNNLDILITGSNGMLANAVKKEFKEHNLICSDINELDITKLDEVRNYIEQNKPDYIINCAAYTRS